MLYIATAAPLRSIRGNGMRYSKPTIELVSLNDGDVITTSLVLPDMPLVRHQGYSYSDNVDYGNGGMAEN